MTTNWVEFVANNCPATQTNTQIVPCFFSNDIILGQFGSVDDQSNFTPRGTITTIPEHQQPVPDATTWTHSVGATHEIVGGLDLAGEAVDPETATKVTVGSSLTYSFSATTNMSFDVGTVYHGSLDPLQVFDLNEEQITVVAQQYGFTTRAGTLKENWVVVTDVFQIIAGVIIGSSAKNETFALYGSANAIEALDAGSVGAGWSYSDDEEKKQTFRIVFPSAPVALTTDGKGVDPNTVGGADRLYTLGFSAMSKSGGTLQAWTRDKLSPPKS